MADDNPQDRCDLGGTTEREVIPLLSYAVNYINQRIQFVDTKASILIAIQIGVMGLVSWCADKLFRTSDGAIEPLAHWLLVVTAILVFAAMFFLVWTIRPTKGFLGIRVGLTTLDCKGVIWDTTRPGADSLEYLQSHLELSDKEIQREYRATLFALKQAVYRKYQLYRIATSIIKIELVVVFAALATLYLLLSSNLDMFPLL